MMHTFAGGIVVKGRRYGDALPPIQQALSIDPDLFPAHAVLGPLYQQTGKADAEIEEYRTAYHLSRGNIVLAYKALCSGKSAAAAKRNRSGDAPAAILGSDQQANLFCCGNMSPPCRRRGE